MNDLELKCINWTNAYMQKNVECKACWPTPVSTAECPPANKPVSKQGTKKMRYSYDEEFDTESRNPERTYLDHRLDSIEENKRGELRKQFKIDPVKPKTFDEAIARIKAGDYQAETEEYQKARPYWSALDFIIWRAPDEKPDHDGFEAATKALNTARNEAEDQIMTLDAKAGLEALNTFKAWTYSA